jgi:hypothetical protein
MLPVVPVSPVLPVLPALALLPQEREGIPGWIIQAILVFFFLVLPILRGIRETIARRKELEARRAQGPAPEAAEVEAEVDELDEARKRFEALLRGEVPPETSAERAAPPTAPPPVTVPPPVPRPTAADRPLTGSLAGPLGGLPPAPSENELEAGSAPATADPDRFGLDEAQRARAEIDRRLEAERAEREARREVLQRDFEPGRRPGVAAEPVASLHAPQPAFGGALPLPSAAPLAAPAARARPQLDVLFPAQAGPAERRAALRRAFVAAEVLGPPIAWRDPDAGAAGLRRTA